MSEHFSIVLIVIGHKFVFIIKENDVINVKVKGEEIRRRFPRIIMNLVMAVIFWIIGVFVPPTVSTVVIPGLNTNADFLIWTVATVVMAIFLIRALSDALVLGDILTDVVVRRLGIKEERSPKRAARDLIYIIIIILVVTALSPILASIEEIGYLLTTTATYIALALIIILIYDIGRILYRIVEQKAELLADRLAEMAEKNKNSE
jgi:cation transport ATPase